MSHDWMTNSHDGGRSESQIFHHSRLTIADTSDVGCCMYCAIHLPLGSSVLSASSSWSDQNSGHKGLPEGKIAGKSITSHSSPDRWAAAFNT